MAGEANEPGRYSKRLVNLLQSLDKSVGTQFQMLCRFSISGDFSGPVIYEFQDEIYKSAGLNLNVVTELQSLGLLSIATNGYQLYCQFEDVNLSYFFENLSIRIPHKTPLHYPFETGHMILTQMGHELASICATSPINGFSNYLLAEWGKRDYNVQRMTSKG